MWARWYQGGLYSKFLMKLHHELCWQRAGWTITLVMFLTLTMSSSTVCSPLPWMPSTTSAEWRLRSEKRVVVLTWKLWEHSESFVPSDWSLESPVSSCLTFNICNSLNIWSKLLLVMWLKTKYRLLCDTFPFFHIFTCLLAPSQAYRWWWTPFWSPCYPSFTSHCWFFSWSLFTPLWDWSCSSAKCTRPATTLARVQYPPQQEVLCITSVKAWLV